MVNNNIYLVLDNIRSAYNVGSIFRTADGAGVSKIYLCGITPTPTRLDLPAGGHGLFKDSRSNLVEGKIAKTALGAEKTVIWEHHFQTWRLLEKLKKERVSIVALEQTKKPIDYRKFKPKLPLALVLGNEVWGLSKKNLSYCNKIIEIPMRGKKESLNVSVAAGIVLYEITKQNS